jgi:hypothetical protein
MVCRVSVNYHHYLASGRGVDVLAVAGFSSTSEGDFASFAFSLLHFFPPHLVTTVSLKIRVAPWSRFWRRVAKRAGGPNLDQYPNPTNVDSVFVDQSLAL